MQRIAIIFSHRLCEAAGEKTMFSLFIFLTQPRLAGLISLLDW